MIGRIFDFVTDPGQMIVLSAVAGTFLTLIALVLPYVQTDPMRRRLATTTKRRQQLRAEQLEALQRRSRLRRGQSRTLKDLVERLRLRELFAGQELRAKLMQANWRGPNALAAFVVARAATPLALGGFAAFVLFGTDSFDLKLPVRAMIVFGAVVAGFYGPNLLMTNAIQKRQQAITLGFPDALDLLLICVESGLSVEAAFGRVAQEIGETAPELAEELELTTAELTYLPERRQALENLSLRTGLPGVKAVTTSLIQAERYGTPLAAALRVAAQENRDKRMANAEKKAAALPAKLTVPMITFFLPVLFLVILGPSIIQILG